METSQYNFLDNEPPPPKKKGKKMKEFAKSRDMELESTAPYQPNSNNAETFMKTLGKATKLGHNNKENEAATIKAAS